MNKKLVFRTLGNILKLDGLFLILPLIISFIYKDNMHWSYIIPMLIILAFGFCLTLFIKKDERDMSMIDGFVVVGLSWILICLFGTLPYIISGSIHSFIDALFETASGFTTTGATILSGSEIEGLSKSILFYREMTHFIGGIGVLVFVLAVLPDGGAKSINLLKAETTGPQASKLVSKVSSTAKILCLIYVVLTLIESVLLVIDPSLDYFDAICYAFSTAGTGGFGTMADSCASMSIYAQMVIAVFMFIFGINFNIFYMIIMGRSFKAFKNEEFRVYVITMVSAIIIIALDIYFSSMHLYENFGLALKDSIFQTSSFMTSTGLSSTQYDLWPALSKSILFVLLYIGACAGSTGGGLKVSRIIILGKSLLTEIKKIFHPRSIQNVKLDGETLDESTVKGTLTYLSSIIVLCLIGVILVSFDNFDFETNLNAVSACINNLGVGFGNTLNSLNAFGQFSGFSKIVLTIEMLIGRLEIYPILLMFNPKIWFKKSV